MPDAAFQSEFLKTLQARGYINQATHPEELDGLAARGAITAYIGFDATAASLHVGHLFSIMTLRRLQQAGHKPIVLMGGGTTKVGDPTDKEGQRPLLTDEQIQANIASIKTVFSRFLTFGDGPTDAVMVNNADWLERFGYVQFLRDYGVHFTINRMLAFDSVKLRLEREQPMTFLEFNYMLMQSVDFLELSRRYGCVLQMGGSDQWGNIVNGVELIRRVDGKPAFGLTTPLLATASGQKMGKTLGGAVWLNADLRSPYDYWQFWRNTEDADVGRFMRLFTDLPLDEIARLEALPGAEINEAKKVLANAATRLLHGAEAATTAEAAATAAFEQGRLSDDLPTHEVDRGVLDAGVALASLAVEAGLAASKGEARRLAKGGGLRLNDRAETDGDRLVTDADIVDGVVKLGAGKKKIVLVKPV
ncbi:tyrosine--tRNA ligase [Phenylobacterium sp. SCN 70-31]|uniref:tyrosine--tRNA ligase n=1 Tax=Phenylobacterium sp. SCN 70-31 TaxID=1660129 RepID=UPI00086B0C4A|nr:tyrosine--tRNA ligase [Phenylobacterium sp. SCN 70-31]ODT87597.1 MAG: tyrosine--tRNA ligase [Phenylobacterium sp. SCN 70-31]